MSISTYITILVRFLRILLSALYDAAVTLRGVFPYSHTLNISSAPSSPHPRASFILILLHPECICQPSSSFDYRNVRC